MANNKIQLADGTILLDLTADTADEEHVLAGYTFHKKDGTTATGAAPSVSPTIVDQLDVSDNGTYTAADGHAYSPVVVNVPTGTARSASDVTVSGASVTVPAGLYSSQVVKSVASGSAGTPTASKGTVSNHSISVTPSVTNTTGYITGGEKTGTAVTVSASELVSGSETKTANGSYDVTNLKTLVVSIPVYDGSVS